MKPLIALLLLLATPAFAADGPVTILRGASAPPQPPYEPPPPPPQPIVVYQPVVYPQYVYVQPLVGAVRQHRNHSPQGWPLFRR
jgi:hypothetical protein